MYIGNLQATFASPDALPGRDARVCKGEPEADARRSEWVSTPQPAGRVVAQPDDPDAPASAPEGAHHRLDGARCERDRAQGLFGGRHEGHSVYVMERIPP